MSRIYVFNEKDRRGLKHLYRQSSIESRYSVLPDYSLPPENWLFYPPNENLEPFPDLEKRMHVFNEFAPDLSVKAIEDCLSGHLNVQDITHLITVTCTGLSAPGLDLQIMDLLKLSNRNIFRTSINFMGCYAAIHALKLADALCTADPSARILIVCTELCTLHFQQAATLDNITSSLIFGDGSAAMLIAGNDHPGGFPIRGFYGEALTRGKQDMSWALSSTGFKMTLSSYIPALIEEDFEKLVSSALSKQGIDFSEITQWSIHPGGRKILEVIEKSLHLKKENLHVSYRVLQDYGNMSSPTILFVLKEILNSLSPDQNENIFGAAFGPGLTMETFIVSN
jgi:predicted naringenin-chalcone synthase